MHLQLSNVFKVLFIIPLIILSCEFDPFKTYEPDINKDKPQPELIINELSFTEDTIYMYENKTLLFDFSAGEEEILAVKVLKNSEELKTFYDSKGEIKFSFEQMQHGVYQITMKIFTSTGTGSLADQIHEEAFQYEFAWTLIVVKDFYGMTASVEDGFLKLDWGEYFGSDLIFYAVDIGYHSGYRCDSSEYIAKGQIGMKEDYGCSARTSSGSIIQFGYISVPNEFPEIKLAETDSGTYYIHWSMPKYYNAIESIRIEEEIFTSTTWANEVVKTVTKMNDTIYYLKNVEKGELRYYHFYYTGKYPKDPYTSEPATSVQWASYNFY